MSNDTGQFPKDNILNFPVLTPLKVAQNIADYIEKFDSRVIVTIIRNGDGTWTGFTSTNSLDTNVSMAVQMKEFWTAMIDRKWKQENKGWKPSSPQDGA